MEHDAVHFPALLENFETQVKYAQLPVVSGLLNRKSGAKRMSLIKCTGNAAETACKTSSAVPFASWRVGLLRGFPTPSHLLTSVLGLQVPHRRCSVAWGQAEDLPALLEKPGTLVGWGLFFPSAAVVPLAFDSSKCELSTLQQLWSIATLRIHVKWLW